MALYVCVGKEDDGQGCGKGNAGACASYLPPSAQKRKREKRKKKVRRGVYV